MTKEKEFLYVGYYIDTEGNHILKIGTTNDLNRRQTEHNRNYRKAKQYTLPKESKFNYLLSIPLSKYNTLRYEDSNRELWKQAGFGEFVPNDRFNCGKAFPSAVEIKIKKTYTISIDI